MSKKTTKTTKAVIAVKTTTTSSKKGPTTTKVTVTKGSSSKKGKSASFPPEQIEEFQNIFKYFDTEGKGTMKPAEVKVALETLGLDKKGPAIYKFIEDLCDPNDPESEVDFDTFLNALYEKFGDPSKKEVQENLFELFLDDPKETSVSAKSFKKAAEKLGGEEVKNMLDDALENGVTLDSEEFCTAIGK